MLRHEAPTIRARRGMPGMKWALVLAAGLLASGCSTDFFTQKPPPPVKPVIDHKAASAEALADDFALLDKLIGAPADQQMQLVERRRRTSRRPPPRARSCAWH